MESPPPENARFWRNSLEVLWQDKILENLNDGSVETKVSALDGNNYVLYVKYKQHLMVLRFSYNIRTSVLLDIAYNLFDSTIPDSQWLVTHIGTVVVQNKNNVCFYQLVNNKLRLLLRCLSGANNGYNIISFGRFFTDNSLVDMLIYGNGSYEIWSVGNTSPSLSVHKISLPREWNQLENIVTVASDFDQSGLDVILLRSRRGLQIFKFDSSRRPQLVAVCDSVTSEETSLYDRIMFAKLSESPVKQMLHFNGTGLNVYGHTVSSNTLQQQFYTPAFSEYGNWNLNYISSIHTNDFNDDGIEDLIFTGPSGIRGAQIARNGDDYRLIEITITAEKLLQHSSKLTALLPRKTSDTVPLLVMFSGNKLYVVGVKEIKEYLPNIEVPSVQNTDAIIPWIIPETQYARWLHDQLDVSEFLQPINTLTGKFEPSIPLIQLDNPFGIGVRKSLQYYDRAPQGPLGRGWYISLDYIIVNYKGSVFEEEFNYFIVKQNQQVPLTRTSIDEATNCDIFVVRGLDDVEIKYDKQNDRWQMVHKESEISYIFGSHGEKQSIVVTDASKSWYYVREAHPSGSFVNYEYNIPDNGVVHITKIVTDMKSSATFEYADGLIKMIKVQTSNYKQDIKLEYESIAGETFLVQVSQDEHTLFKFSYDEKSKVIDGFTFPNGMHSKLEYQTITIDPHIYSVESMNAADFRFCFGPDYSLLVDKLPDLRTLVIRVKDLVGSENSAKVSLIRLEIEKQITAYQILTLENLFAIVLTHTEGKFVKFYHFDGGDWLSSDVELINMPVVAACKDAIFIYSDYKLFNVFLKNNNVILNLVSSTTLNDNFIITAYSSGAITYDDEYLYFHYKLTNDEWLQHKEKIKPGLLSTLESTIDQFDLTEKARNNLLYALKLDGIQFYQKLIVIRYLVIRGGILKVRFWHCFTNKNHGVESPDEYEISIGKIDELTLTVKSDQEDSCVLGYELKNEKHKVFVKQCEGPTMQAMAAQLKDEISKITSSQENPQRQEQLTAEVNERHAQKEQLFYSKIISENPYAFDSSLLGIVVDSQGISTAGKIVWFDGEKWTQRDALTAVDMKLDENFTLKKSEGSDSYKIYQGDEMMFDANTGDSADVYLRWPKYFLAQPKGSPLKMFTFSNKKIVEFSQSERFSMQSNNLLLVTTDTVSKRVRYRSVETIEHSEVLTLSKQTLNLAAKIYRITTYEYANNDIISIGNGLIFKKCKILPGGNSVKFGWYEHRYDAIEKKSTRDVFDGTGNFIKSVEPQKDTEFLKPDRKTSITDKFGKLSVVDVYPRNVSQGEIFYYGFENYEQLELGDLKPWKFNMKDLYSLNGNQYLQLSDSNSVFEATFVIKNNKEKYIFSCWIRTNTSCEVGSLFNQITVSFENEQKQALHSISGATVRQIIHTWCYVELIPIESDLKDAYLARVKIAPIDNVRIEIDHIRFSPMNIDFKANVYRPVSSIPSGAIRNNGIFTQHLFDPNGNKVVYFTEQGNIRDFVTYTKAYALVNQRVLPQVLELQPRFGEYEDFVRWESDNMAEWQIQNGRLIHKTTGLHTMFKSSFSFDDVLAIRFLYNLESEYATIRIVHDDQHLNVMCRSTEYVCGKAKEDGPGYFGNTLNFGEFVVLFTKARRMIWLDGRLVYEGIAEIPNVNKIGLSVSGSLKISEMLFLYNPLLKITYYNQLDQPIQILVSEEKNSVRVKQIMYDEINRPIISTKWTSVPVNDTMFNYHANFITSIKSSKLEGLVNQYNPECGGYPYFGNRYSNDPTDEMVATVLPDKELATNEKNIRKFARKSVYQFLDVLFPPDDGFTQEIESRLDGITRVTLKNKSGKTVALYVRISDYDQRLSTHEYDDENLVLELPPLYHLLADTVDRQEPFWNGKLSEKEKKLQKIWGIYQSYNDQNRLVTKRTVDAGTQQYVYSNEGVVRFIMHYNETQLDKNVYLSYGPTGKIVKEALVDINEQDLERFTNTSPPPSTDFVEYYHGEYDPQPAVRYRSQQSVRSTGNKQLIESLLFDENNQIKRKIFVVPALNTTYSINYEYQNDQLKSIRYPVDVRGTNLVVAYKYNYAGNLDTISSSSFKSTFVKFQYNADNFLKEMHFESESDNSYSRWFGYSNPGYISSIKDKFLEESISYLESESYGSFFSAVLDGLITRTSFIANWHNKSKPALSHLELEDIIASGLNETIAKSCLQGLMSSRYLDIQQMPLRSLYTKLDNSLADACKTSNLIQSFHANAFSKVYGHSYDYDGFGQLVAGKYFQNAAEASFKPMTEDIFLSNIPALGRANAEIVWNVLSKNGFITNSCMNPGMCHGNPGTSFLNKLIPQLDSIQSLFADAISNRKTIAHIYFQQVCEQWLNSNINCGHLWEQLSIHNIVGIHSRNSLNALDVKFQNALVNFSDYIPEIVGVLHKHFGYRLGQSPGDILSCLFDANGNHRLFYLGHNQYQFTYKANTNQISTITKTDLNDKSCRQKFEMKHNSEGSVIIALHKAIESIEYDKLINRPSRITMADNRVLKFEYDVRGERTFKQVQDAEGNVYMEKYYIRDTDGNVLVDLKLTFLTGNNEPDVLVTSYIYSDSRKLIGFIRNDEFYSVFTDHEGSVRLVIKDNIVKAAYDYHPYGHVFRKSEESPGCGIAYLYTGQEWDEETGLYNYHTRLYDPEIGRFFQVDPLGQYASPYVYAGNSPIALVDPDGQFAFLIFALFLAIAGAYLGGAAANESWNPASWDWKSGKTWLGIVGGALAGATLPYNMGSTLSYFIGLGLSTTTSLSIMIGSGIGISYLTMAAANNNWDPSKWDMHSPETWNAFFSGIAISSWLTTNPHGLMKSFSSISSMLGKTFFVAGKVMFSGGFMYMFGVLSQDNEFNPAKWDYSKPGFYLAMLNGITMGTTVVQQTFNLPKSLQSLKKKIISMLDYVEEMDAFITYNTHVGDNWFKRFENARYFLKANAAGVRAFEKGALEVTFYTVVTSLRMSESIGVSEVPEFSIMVDFLDGFPTTREFSNFLIENIVPKMGSRRLLQNESLAQEVQPVSSSGTTTWLNSILKMFLYRKPDVRHEECRGNIVGHFDSKRSNVRKSYSISNCYQFFNAESNVPYVECYGLESKVSMHLKSSPPTVSLTEDAFHECHPLTYNGISSVFCDGINSSLLFTSFEGARVFDYVDSWILLIQVLPAAVRNIVNGFCHVINPGEVFDSLVSSSSSSLISMENKIALLKEIRKISAQLRNKNDSEFLWAKQLHCDLEDDVMQFMFGKDNKLSRFSLLKEKTNALYEDIREQIELKSFAKWNNLFANQTSISSNVIRRGNQSSYTYYHAFNFIPTWSEALSQNK